jgi:two-component system, NarL family, nitrate/nitrite response regulator NarL
VTTPPSTATSGLSPSAAQPIRVFLAEDHAITLWGLQRLIESQPDVMTVVGTASTREAFLGHAALAQADLLLMDLDLAGADGLDLLPEVQRRCTAKVLVLTASEDTPRLCRAVELGAKGVLHKSEPPQNILKAIEQVRQGGAWLNPQLMGEVLGRLTSTQPRSTPAADSHQARLASLTAREHDIFVALSQNPSDKLMVVANQLGMSENTLRNHLTTVYAKLGVRGRLELHVFAAESGLAPG